MRNSPLRAFAKNNDKKKKETKKDRGWKTYYPNSLIDPNEKDYWEKQAEKAKKYIKGDKKA